MKPYLGLGILMANGTIDPSYVTATSNSTWNSTIHISLGTEIELPLNITAQLDLMNLAFGGSLFVGKKF